LIYYFAVKVAITDRSFHEILGDINLPSYLFDKSLSRIIKFNYAGELLLEENKSIIENISLQDEILASLDSIGVYFSTADKYIKTFTSIKIDGIDSVLLSITEVNKKREYKINQETSKALKKEVVNHSITRIELNKSKELSRKLISSNTDMLLMVRKDGTIYNSNRVINKILEYDKNELNNLKVDLIFKENSQYQKLLLQLEKNNSFEGKIELISKSGNTIPTHFSITAYEDKSEEFLFTIKNLSDKITIKKQALKMKAILDSGQHMIWSINKEFALTSFNENYKEIYYKTYNDNPVLNKILSSLEHRNDEQEIKIFWDQKYSEAFKGKTVSFETKLTYLDGSFEFKEIHLNPIIEEGNSIQEVSGIGIDITERKLTEMKLNKNTARYNSIFNNASVIIWSIDREKKITASNNSFEIAMSSWFSRVVSINSDFEDYFSSYGNEKAIEIFNVNFDKALKNKKRLFEIKFLDRNSNERILEIYMSPIIYADNEIDEMSCIAVDVTETKTASNELNESLKEKETLLQEVHHRVKNNLQIISSILNLQASYLKDEKSLKILTESQNRIKSMSFIHESLYINNNFRYIDFKDYIKSLTSNLIQSYSLRPDKVKFISQVSDVQLSLDQAIPCGLILNELISNSLKYAFPGDIRGEIALNISEKGNNVRLELSDNGIGIPKDFDVEKSESLGLQLVFILVEQLDGNIEIGSDKGSNFLINFDKIKNT